MLALAAVPRQRMNPGTEGDEPVTPEGAEAHGAGRQPAAQIVMRLEFRPRLTLDPADFESDGRPSLKQPPGKGPRKIVGRIANPSSSSRPVHPIGIEPRLDILVAGDGDEFLTAAAHGPGQGVRADLGDRAIDDRSEFVHYGQCRLLGK